MRPTSAPFSLRDAHLINAVLTLGYVLPLYLSNYIRLAFTKIPDDNQTRVRRAPELGLGRDDPSIIKTRLLSVFISTTASIWLMHNVVVVSQSDTLQAEWRTTALQLGFSMSKHDVAAYFLTPVVFLGPLYGRYLSGDLPFMDEGVRAGFSWASIRNYIAGPISEELIWRSCLVCVYRLAGASNTFMIFFTPISFGAAHLHHVWEIYNRLGRTRAALQRAILGTLFQFTYTTLFGFHATFLLLRTSSLFPSIFAHIFCNIMGFPQLLDELRWFPHRRRQILFAYFLGDVLYIYGMISWTLRPESIFWFHGASKQ